MRPTLWTLWRCERGAQWATTEHGCDHSKPCEFSGCDKQPHTASRIARTDDRELAANWFTRPASHA